MWNAVSCDLQQCAYAHDSSPQEDGLLPSEVVAEEERGERAEEASDIVNLFR